MLTGRSTVTGLTLAALICERTAQARRQSAAAELLREHAALRDVAAMVARGHELEALCARVAESAAGLLDGEVGLVLRFEGPQGVLVGRWVRRLRNFPQCGEQYRFEPDSAIGHVRAHRGTARVAPGSPSPFRHDLGERVASPIELDGELWGAVAVAGTRARPLPTRGEVRLESFAELVALAIGNAEARAQLVAQATTDALTGMANRRAFDARLASECLRAQRYGRPLSLIVFDIDRFKSINDSVGHLAGDEVLTEAAVRLSAALRPDALLGRLGGDEFAAVLPECDGTTAQAVAERAVRAVSARAIGELSRVTVSAGVTELSTADAGPDALLQRADVELYRAKQTQRPALLTVIRGSSAA